MSRAKVLHATAQSRTLSFDILPSNERFLYDNGVSRVVNNTLIVVCTTLCVLFITISHFKILCLSSSFGYLRDKTKALKCYV